VARETAGQRADLQGAAGVSAADLGAEAAGVLAEGDLDNDGDTDTDDDDIAALTGDREEPGTYRPPRRRGPSHEDVTAEWDFHIPPTILPYLKRDELRVIPMRRHVIRLAGPALAFVGGLVLAIALNAWAYSSGHAGHLLVHTIWWSWFLGAGWAVYKWLEWRQTWFVVTGFRLMLVETTRLLGRRVRMLPLDKLRDLEFSQTALGRWQGYATFTFASIGTGGAENAPPVFYEKDDVLPQSTQRSRRRPSVVLGGLSG
jgi:hypothetical protein